jgi:serine/threonine protein kinase
MRKFKGHDLIKWLKDDMVEQYLADPHHSDEEKRSYAQAHSKTKLPAWSLDDRFELSLALLRALLTQIHARGLVHRDIKPQNIKVDKDANGFNVNIFDLNLSRLSSKPDGRACGTPSYLAPDYDINGVAELDEKSDVFSIALVLAMIWRDSVQREICDSANSIHPLYERESSNWSINFNIGAAIDGFSDKIKQDLTNLLQFMTKKNKPDRADLSAAIIMLEDIYLAHKLTKIPSVYHQGVRDAVNVARVARVKLQELSCRQVNPYSVKSLGEELKSQIKLLHQNCYATREFVAALGIASFNRYVTESMLIDNVDEIVTKFIGAHEEIEKQRQQLRDLFMIVGAEKTISTDKAARLRLVSGQIAHLGTCLEKVAHTPLTLDNVAAETSRLMKKAANIQRALDGFDELKPAREVLARLVK